MFIYCFVLFIPGSVMEYWNQNTTLSSKPRGSLQVSIYKFLQTICGEYITQKGQTTLPNGTLLAFLANFIKLEITLKSATVCPQL